jgi:hypothetical protein
MVGWFFVQLRLSQAKKDFNLANEALDAATAVYEMEMAEVRKLDEAKSNTSTKAKGYKAVSMFSNIIAEKERTEAEDAHALWEKEHEEATAAEAALEKEAAEANDADRKLHKMRNLAAKKHREALSHIKAVRYLDKEAAEAAAAATLIQARFRGYQVSRGPTCSVRHSFRPPFFFLTQRFGFLTWRLGTEYSRARTRGGQSCGGESFSRAA